MLMFVCYVNAQNTGYWEVDYSQDEFGDKDYNDPYIHQTWVGKRNNTFDCGLGVRFTKTFVQLTIMEKYMEPNLKGVIVTGQFNGKKFNVNYSLAENESVYISYDKKI